MGPFAEGWTEQDVERVLERADPQELLYVPIVVGMNAASCEQTWAEKVCMGLSDHPHFNVRGNAMLGLGHIARTCGTLDLEHAVPVISRGLVDKHEYVRAHANNAACELHLYLGVLVPGYDTAHTESLLNAFDEVRKRNDA